LTWPDRWSTAWSTREIAPAGGAGWACPFCPQQAVFWPLCHRVMVKGQADALHVRAIREVPVHLDDIVVELTEADENWLALNTITWSGVVAR
jgi:hypothetical protein